MSWGTSIKLKHKSIYLQSIDLTSLRDLDDQIKDSNKVIDDCFKRLEQLALATPKDIAPSKKKKDDEYGYDSPYEFIQEQLRNIREEFDDEIWKLIKLQFARFALEEYEYSDSSDKEKIDLNKDWDKIVTRG